MKPADTSSPAPGEAGRASYAIRVKESIADAVVAKDEDVFLLSHPSGDVPLDGEHGLGLYYHDCRYPSGYELTINGVALTALEADASRGFALRVALTSPTLALSGGDSLPPRSISVTRERMIEHEELAVHEIVMIRNHAPRSIVLCVELAFHTEFEDIFVVRGLKSESSAHLPHVTLEGLRVGDAKANLRFDRGPDGAVTVNTLRIDGELELEVVPAGEETGGPM